MSKSKVKSNSLTNGNMVKYLRIFLIASLMVIIFYPPYLQGLFFEKQVLPTQIIVFIVFIIFLIYKWIKNDYSFFKTPIEYVSFGFVIVYFISIFVAVHTRSAIIEWLKYCMYFVVFYMISDLADDLKVKMLFLWTIVISAVGVSIIGLDAAMGGNFVKLLNRFFNILGVKGNLFFGLFVDNRIHSTLQYPNALASYLMAVFFITIGLLLSHNKWWQKIILGSAAYILFLTFMLTQSRGAQILFPIAVVILFIAAPKGERIKVITHVIILAIPAGVISLFISPYLSSDQFNRKAFLLLLIGLLITVLISLVVKFIGNLLQRISWKIYIAIISIIIIVILIGLQFIINSSVPAELSLIDSDENKTVNISKDVVLKPNKEYILRFEAESNMKEDTPYAFSIGIYSKNISDILFYEVDRIIWKEYPVTDGFDEIDIDFRTKEDTKLVNINFSIYYSGTSVKLNNASIVDAETGKVVKKIILKNKYNLDNVISRFEHIWLQHSIVTRAVFYKDGFNIFKDKWILGAGGGAWNYLYRQYQSYNYASSQAHNYPLQLGIETGILGILILIILVIALIIIYVKYYKKINTDAAIAFEGDSDHSTRLISSVVITSITSLLMHSIIDFDFSECAMLLLFWQLIALLNREFLDNSPIEDLVMLNVKIKSRRSKYVKNKEQKSVIFIGIFISVIALYFSTTFLIASSIAKQSFESFQNNDFGTAISKIEKAINIDGYNEKYVLGYNPILNRPDIKAGFVDILFLKKNMYMKAQEEGENIPDADLSLLQKQFSKVSSYIKDVERKAKNNLSLTTDLASYYFKVGEINKGIYYINSAINYFPFEPSLWHSKIDVYYQLMGNYFNDGDYEKAEEYLIKGLNVINEAMEINKKNLNPFVFSQNSVELLQKMKFIKDNWNSEEIAYINKIIHYSMFNLDINMDGIPDQWRISNKELINLSVNEENLTVQASSNSYLYTNYPIKLEKGKAYQIEIDTKGKVEYLFYYLSGITSGSLPLVKDDSKYTAEFLIENEPDKKGNQLILYLKSDCDIVNILIKEK